MTETMFAYRFNKSCKKLNKEKIKIPEPQKHEVLARTLGSGLCHTDLHILQGDLGDLPHDVTLGHEGVGIIEKLGPCVERFQVGDFVGIAWLANACLDCQYCRRGDTHLCLSKLETGYTKDGTHAEYFIADERFAAHLPTIPNMLDYAPVLCAGVTSYRAVHRFQLPKGSRIVITGANGGLGLMAIQYAKALQYQVVALGRMNPDKIQRAKSLGADFIVDTLQTSNDQELVQLVLQYSTPEHPILGVLVLSPDPSVIETAIDYIDRGGTIVTVILPKKSLTLNLLKFTIKELTLRSSLVGTPEELQAAINMTASGQVKTHVVRKCFDSIHESLALLGSRSVAGRIVLTSEADAK